MSRIAAFLYGILCYLAFLLTMLYAIGFVGNLGVPRSIDSAPGGPLLPALAIDALLLALFAVQHSVMARPGFKRWWTRVIPRSIERSTYVLFSSLALALLFWQWRAIPGTVWSVSDPVAAGLLRGLRWVGWGIVLASTFMIDHFRLFGVKQVLARLLDRTLPEARFVTPLLYKLIRHPIMLGFLIAFWASPVMTVAHLLFSLLVTGYIMVGIRLEERDLVALFGEEYLRYRQQTPALIPRPGHGHDLERADEPATTS